MRTRHLCWRTCSEKCAVVGRWWWGGRGGGGGVDVAGGGVYFHSRHQDRRQLSEGLRLPKLETQTRGV